MSRAIIVVVMLGVLIGCRDHDRGGKEGQEIILDAELGIKDLYPGLRDARIIAIRGETVFLKEDEYTLPKRMATVTFPDMKREELGEWESFFVSPNGTWIVGETADERLLRINRKNGDIHQFRHEAYPEGVMNDGTSIFVGPASAVGVPSDSTTEATIESIRDYFAEDTNGTQWMLPFQNRKKRSHINREQKLEWTWFTFTPIDDQKVVVTRTDWSSLKEELRESYKRFLYDFSTGISELLPGYFGEVPDWRTSSIWQTFWVQRGKLFLRTEASTYGSAHVPQWLMMDSSHLEWGVWNFHSFLPGNPTLSFVGDILDNDWIAVETKEQEGGTGSWVSWTVPGPGGTWRPWEWGWMAWNVDTKESIQLPSLPKDGVYVGILPSRIAIVRINKTWPEEDLLGYLQF